MIRSAIVRGKLELLARTFDENQVLEFGYQTFQDMMRLSGLGIDRRTQRNWFAVAKTYDLIQVKVTTRQGKIILSRGKMFEYFLNGQED